MELHFATTPTLLRNGTNKRRPELLREAREVRKRIREELVVALQVHLTHAGRHVHDSQFEQIG